VLFGGPGVVAGFVIGLLAGSLLVAVAYSVEHGYSLSLWLAPDNLVLGAATLCGMAAVLLLYYRLGSSLDQPLLIIASLTIYGLFAGVPLWLHSARRQLHAWAQQVFASLRAKQA
jgi:hypothetical protein